MNETAKQIDDGGSAFPVTMSRDMNTDCATTLRDYFAAKAMQGLCAVPNDSTYGTPNVYTREEWISREYAILATTAYAIADAMLKLRQP